MIQQHGNSYGLSIYVLLLWIFFFLFKSFLSVEFFYVLCSLWNGKFKSCWISLKRSSIPIFLYYKIVKRQEIIFVTKETTMDHSSEPINKLLPPTVSLLPPFPNDSIEFFPCNASNSRFLFIELTIKYIFIHLSVMPVSLSLSLLNSYKKIEKIKKSDRWTRHLLLQSHLWIFQFMDIVQEPNKDEWDRRKDLGC